jgi:uncharacterized membrane protein YhhN
MIHLIPIPFLAVTVTLLVRARLRDDRRQEYIFKPASTLLVILVALLSLATPAVHVPFTLWITLGLVLSLGGDVALMLRTSRWFLIGLVLFLLAHVVYAITFTVPNGFHPQDLVTGAALAAFGAVVYAYLLPGLRSMKVPVLLYVVVILFMVNRALSTFFGTAFTPAQAWLLSLGAILFMLSDLVLAVNRFRRPLKYEATSLFAYYAGQLLIALSAAYFAPGL